MGGRPRGCEPVRDRDQAIPGAEVVPRGRLCKELLKVKITSSSFKRIRKIKSDYKKKAIWSGIIEIEKVYVNTRLNHEV